MWTEASKELWVIFKDGGTDEQQSQFWVNSRRIVTTSGKVMYSELHRMKDYSTKIHWGIFEKHAISF